MARIIPIGGRMDADSQAEVELLGLIQRSLDDSWTVFHSFSYVGHTLDQHHLDGEIDFLFLHPKHGILVFEVKGGKISYRDGVWFQYDKPIDPFGQARKNKYQLMDHLHRHFGERLPLAVTHAVCFPDCHNIPNLPMEGEGITVTGQLLPYLEDSITDIMSKAPFVRDADLGEKEMTQVLRVLMPQFEYGESLPDLISRGERKIFRLTEQQCDLLNALQYHRRVLVQGCAGSGKTVMAVKKARELAAAGFDVLLLCFNTMLGEHLQKAVEDQVEHITATTYHQFCLDQLEKHGYDVCPDGKPGTFWTEDVPNMFAEMLDEHPLQYDALIVDEGQDFREDYWISVEGLVREDGWFYVFYDPEQDLYQAELKLPDLGSPFLLKCNCRNTKAIFNELKPYSELDIQLREGAPEGAEVRDIHVGNAAECRRELGKLLYDLVKNEGLREEQIVVLGGHSLKHTLLAEDHHVGQFEVVENEKAVANRISYHTYMKFKGCESDVVILLGVNPEDSRWQRREALYTAMSRARHLLCVVHRDGC